MVLTAMLIANFVTGQTVQIGAGTDLPPATLYSPFYRFSAGSTTTMVRSNILFTDAELSAAGIVAGSTITAVEFYKGNVAQLLIPANFKMYMANTSNTSLATTTTWASILTTHTEVYNNAAFSLPDPVGWVNWAVTPFVYTGGSLEIATDLSMTGGTTGATNFFQWQYTSGTPTDRIIGATGTTGPATLNGTVAAYKFRPNIRITFSTGSACTSPPVPGVATALPSTPVCAGTAVTLNVTGNSSGTGQTYTWQSSAALGGPYTDFTASSGTSSTVVNPTVPTYYRIGVTCGGVTTYSVPVLVTATPAMPAGTYTINSAQATGGTNFQTFAAALTALNCGIAGPVVFNVAPASGPYTEQVTIPSITGASAVNTITFNGNGRVLQFTPVTGARHIIRLNGADYVTINNLNITGLDATYGWGVHLQNGADFNSITNCTINLTAVTNTTQSNSAGIVSSNSSSSVTTTGNNSNNTIITGNIINGAYQGIILNGIAATKSFRNDISNNTIQDFYATGIELVQNDGTVLGYNNIHRANRTAVTTFTGIEIGTGNINTVVNANRIHDTHNAGAAQTGAAYGIFFNACDAPTRNENKVINNLVYNFNSGSGIQYGLYNSSSDSVWYYHNTIVLDNASSTAGTTRGFYQLTTARGIEFGNNIIKITRGGTGIKHVVYHGATGTASTIVSNSNNLFINSPAGTNSTGYLALPSVADYATLANWQAGSGQDAVSVAKEPQFNNAASGNYTPFDPTLDNIGIPVGVATDILNIPRSATTPDIGAYEISISGCTAPPTPGTATASPAGPVCSGTLVSLNLTGHTVGTGQTYQWQSAVTSGGSFTNVSGVLTNPNFDVNPASTLFYRVAVTCSGNTQNSSEIQVVVPGLFPGGTYTINSALSTGGGNFQSFGDAVNAIACGIAGPVTFNVSPASGPYTEQFTIPAITGSSAVNTIIFNGNGRTLQFTPVTGIRHIIKLDGADYVTINNLNITGLDATYGWGIHLQNEADYNRITNCTINMSAVTSTTQANSAGIVASSSPSSVTTTGNNANNTTITGNTITGAYQGIIMNGIAATKSPNNNISNNTIHDFYATGIELTHNDGTVISNNNIHRTNRAAVTTFAGIEIATGCLNMLVNANRIHDTHNAATTQTGTAYGIFFNACDAPGGSENRVTNNLVYNFNSASGIQYGIYNSGSDGARYYHNTIVLDNAASTGGVTRGFLQLTTASSIEFRNNIIKITRGGTGIKHVVYYGATTTASSILSDNNDLFINSPSGTNYTGYLALPVVTDYATLTDWQTGSSMDAASVATEPQFNNAAAGNYTPFEPTLDNTGVPVGVTTDILNTARSAATPDIGAYEITISGCTSPPTPGTATATPLLPVCSGTLVSLNLTGQTVGAGQTYRWQSAATSGGSFTNISGVLTTPDFDINPTTTMFYRVAVTCSGNTQNSSEIQVVVTPPLPAGPYTINSTQATGGSNFQSFAHALNALSCGIAGPITFNVDPASGPYNEQVTIPQIVGAGPSSRIVFNGNGRVLTFNSTNTNERAGIKLNGADYITINNLVITATGSATTEYGYGIQVLGDADDNTISNCTININTSSTSTNYSGIAIGGSATLATTTGGNADNTIVSNNTVNGGNYGISLVGLTTALIQNNQVINNIVKDADEEGIYVSGTNNTLVEGNDISRPLRLAPTDFTGVFFTALSLNAKVSKNRIHDPYAGSLADASAAYGIYFTACDATPGNENIVSNNLIYNFNGGGIQYALYNSGSDSVRYYHNTISMEDAAYAGTAATRGFYQITTARGIEFKNNIIKISRGGAGAKHLLYFGATTTASTIASDNNDLLMTSPAGTNFTGYLAVPAPATSYATLALWQGASGQDAASVAMEPLFTNPVAGNFAPREILLDNLGAGVGITTDILNVSRAATPDIGAYEFTGSITLPVKLLNIFANKVKNDVLVNWSTASELNSSHYEIERSVNGTLFVKAGTLESHNNATGSAYSFKDINAVGFSTGSTMFYRLKIVDKDGRYEYSPVAVVKLDKDLMTMVDVYPNPFVQDAVLRINVTSRQLARIRVTDMSGRVFYNRQQVIQAGINLVSIKNSHLLAGGSYLATVVIEGKQFAVKLVRQ